MKRHLTPSLVLSVVALFVALGGTGYAISQLPKNSVGPAQIKKNAINSAKVKNRSLMAVDFKQGQLPKGPTGPVGPTGATGAAGASGGALAYAYVEDIGTVNVPVDRSEGITTSMVTRPQTGVYCFELSSLGQAKSVSVTPESNFNNLTESDKIASAQLLQNSDFGFGCPGDSDMVVVVRDVSSNSQVNWFFYVTLN